MNRAKRIYGTGTKIIDPTLGLLIIPIRQKSAAAFIWRRVTIGYPPPPEFYAYCGRFKLTIREIEDLAEQWLKAKDRRGYYAVEWFRRERHKMRRLGTTFQKEQREECNRNGKQ